MSTALAFREDRRAGWFYCNDFHVRILRFQVFTNSCQRTAGADACNEDIHFTICVFPDFRTSRFTMRLRVCRVYKLSRNESSFNFFCQFFCLCDRTFHSLGSLCQNDFCTICFQNVSSFYTHGLRHSQDSTVTLGCCDCCKSDPGISGCRLDDHRTFLQLSGCFCILDHSLCDSILNASCRIEIFQFYQNMRIQIICFFYVCQFY